MATTRESESSANESLGDGIVDFGGKPHLYFDVDSTLLARLLKRREDRGGGRVIKNNRDQADRGP